MTTGSIGAQQLRADDHVRPMLETGDHLSQPEFHARYAMMPAHIKAELIGGIVYRQSSLKRSHGRSHSLLMYWLGCYEEHTPGVEAYDNSTTIMKPDSEPQPDACLIIAPDRGGQTRFTPDDYLEGAPELIAEVASSSESIDLHAKLLDYQRAGVREYLVVALRHKKIYWFINRDGRFEELAPATEGYYQSDVFPGLWLDPTALIALDGKRLLQALRLGLATSEHAAFAKQLAAQGPPAQ